MDSGPATKLSPAQCLLLAAGAPGAFIGIALPVGDLLNARDIPWTGLSVLVAIGAMFWFVHGCARQQAGQTGHVSASAVFGSLLLLLGGMTLSWLLAVTIVLSHCRF